MKKKSYKEKRKKKKLVQKFGNLLLPNSCCEGEIVLQDLEVYCNRKACWKCNELEILYCNRLGGWQSYCNTIVTEAGCWLGRQCHDTKLVS